MALQLSGGQTPPAGDPPLSVPSNGAMALQLNLYITIILVHLITFSPL